MPPQALEPRGVRSGYRSLQLTMWALTGTVATGLVLRFAHLGLPPFVVKYGGSTMWAAMIYWLVSAFVPPRRTPQAMIFAVAIATGVEFFKLYRNPAIDSFRGTIAGLLFLGRVFSWWDIAAYMTAIAIAGLLDRKLRARAG